MRIVTWNCHGGECHAQADHPRLNKPDIVVLQECSAPVPPPDDQCLFFGPPAFGVGVVARGPWMLEEGPTDPAIPWVYPVKVTAPMRFHLLAVWAHPEPNSSYVQCILRGLAHYDAFLRAAPSVVIGDFNSHTYFPPPSGPNSHTALICRLHEFGLVSAFHHAPHHHGIVVEVPTYYHAPLNNAPFHIDYCFIPGRWVRALIGVNVGTFADWHDESDHCPVSVELNFAPPAANPPPAAP